MEKQIMTREEIMAFSKDIEVKDEIVCPKCKTNIVKVKARSGPAIVAECNNPECDFIYISN